MDALLDRLEERIGLSRADLLGLAVALVGCVLATVVALRVPLLAALDGGPGGDPTAAGASPGAVVATPTTAAGAPAGAPLLVHVAGAVARPGVVRLEGGDRVADALDAAGGALPDAALAALNLARPLVDGEQVVVPTHAEAEAGAPTAGGATAAGTAAGPTGLLPDGRTDLNSATAEQLEELPGVGPVLAQRILAHRDEHGPFATAASLRDVSGIGESTWASLRDLVGVR